MSSSPNRPGDAAGAPADEQPARIGKSPHAFMREALVVQTRLLEHRHGFLAAALAAERATLEDGRGYAAAAVDAYFEALAAEIAAVEPRPTTWRR